LGNTSTAATLIVGPSWVGDMVMAQSLFTILKARSPERVYDVLAPQWSLPIVARMPEIRHGIASETGHREMGFGKRKRIAKNLRAANYDHAIVLPRSFKSALIPWFANIPRRTGFRGEMRFGLINDMRAFDRNALDQTVKRFAALGVAAGEALAEIPNPALSVSTTNQERLLEILSLDTTRPIVAMMPGAEYGPAKCWPLTHFAELATQLENSGFSVWVLGSEKDALAGEQIRSNSAAINLCGKTTLAEVIDLLALAQHAVSNDSGLMHIAAAVGAHVHGIYGSSSPLFTPPLTVERTIHHLKLDCSPCYERNCPLLHLDCLKRISAASVHAKIV
jgi:heptosyltransferase-2